MKLFDSTFNLLEQSLNFSAERNRMIANNIANVDTPYYKSKDVEFKSVLQNEIHKNFTTKMTNKKHIPFNTHTSNYKVITNQTTSYNHNQNNVDIDKEMANLAQNQIYYRVMVDNLNGKFNTLQTVIRGGR